MGAKSNAATLLCLLLLAVACHPASQPVSAPTTSSAVVAPSPSAAPPPAVASITPPPPQEGVAESESPDTESTGVKECDDYIAAIFACMKDPKAAAGLKPAITQMARAWAQAAADPTARANIVAGCKMAMSNLPASCH